MAFWRPKVVLTTPRSRGWFARWSYALTVVAAMAVVAVIGVTRIPPELNNLLFDWYQRLHPRAWDQELPVRIVAVDDESLARLGRWPWPRSTIADLVSRLGNLGAAVVAVDVVFAEPEGETADAILAAAIAKTPTVLGAILTQGGSATQIPSKHGLATAGDDPLPFLSRFSSVVLPLPALNAAAAGIGALNWLADRDQVVRRVPVVFALGDKAVASFLVEILRVAQGASTVVVRSSNASGQSAFGAHSGVNSVKVGDIEIPTDPHAELRVRYSHSEPRRFIPAWEVLSGNVDRGQIENRVILFGVSAAGLRDQRATPVDASVAGVEIHAQTLEQVLSGAWLTRPDWMPGAELLAALALALVFGVALQRVTAAAGAIAAGLVLGILCWSSWYAFTAQGLLVDPILPGGSLVIAYVACVVWLYRDEQRQRKFVREAFGRYVSPAVVARLSDDPAKLVLGGEQRTLTIMFCDVRGFTTMAEGLDARQLTQFMNEYLTAMTDVVLAHNGTVDKFIGDAIMAFWNAPLGDSDHARHAGIAALAMTRELDLLNERWRNDAQAREAPGHPVRFGIGLATGDCYVGNFGSDRRFSYSALGNSVNLASRLEGANKFYQTDILCAESTRVLSPELAWLEADDVRLKGMTESTRVFVLADGEAEQSGSGFAELSAVHDRMLAAYRRGEFAAAASLASDARGLASVRLRDFYAFYERRCRVLVSSRPDGWTPVTALEEK
jgi:adenylate cyclase